jgi:hypothetical protein
MADLGDFGRDDAITFMVSAGLVYEVVAAMCSSPQTAEINARARSRTLMKWVKIGLANAALFVLIAAYKLGGNGPALLGGALAGVTMGLAYVFANKWGLESAQPGTETY